MSRREPFRAAIDDSGVNKILAPSRYERKQTPSSDILRTWPPSFLPSALQFVGDRAVGERKDLKSSRIGDDRQLAVDKAVQAARLPYDLRPRLEQQVIGIAKHQLQADRIDSLVIERLDRPVGADGDKTRRIDGSMRRMDAPGPRPRFF